MKNKYLSGLPVAVPHRTILLTPKCWIEQNRGGVFSETK
jgi:hypothetical protein